MKYRALVSSFSFRSYGFPILSNSRIRNLASLSQKEAKMAFILTMEIQIFWDFNFNLATTDSMFLSMIFFYKIQVNQ